MSLVFSLLFILLSVYVILKGSSKFPTAVPLWFSQSWGPQRLSEPIFLWLLPSTSLLLVIVNFSFASYLKAKIEILPSLLIWTTPVVSILLFYTLLKIILVVTY